MPTDDHDTQISLKEFVTEHWRMHENEHRSQSEAHEREHMLLEQAEIERSKRLDLRLEQMNEIRAQLTDQADTFARQDNVEGRFKAFSDQLEAMEINMDSKRDTLVNRVSALERVQSSSEGRGGGSSQTVIWLFMGISALAALAGLINIIVVLTRK